MSKRKFGTGTSYSSLRRQVAAQVNADIQFFDNDDHIDVSADNYAGDISYRTLAGPVDRPTRDHTVMPTDDTVSVDDSITPQTCSETCK